MGEFTIEVNVTKSGKKPLVPFLQSVKESAGRHIGLSLFLHAAVVASLAYFLPSLGSDDAESMSRDQMMTMQHLLDAAAVNEQERLEASGQTPSEGGDVGERAKAEEGKMGSAVAPVANARWAKKGPADNPNPQLSREQMKLEAANSGMISLLAGLNASDNAPVSPWAPEVALGKDEMSANGNMWGDTIGDAFGTGGLGMTGGGIGGGGLGEGVGLGRIGTGHGDGTIGGPGGLGNCTGGPCGIGVGRGPMRQGYVPHKVTARVGTPIVNGHIPAEVIQRIVRQNFGRFRNCYESGARTNPTLSGRVATRFVIDRTGAVNVASDGGSDLPDRAVVSCVVRSFQGLSFPQPDGGIVTVTYPIMFSPGE